MYVEFDDAYRYVAKTEYKHCKSGGIKNPYHKTLYGVGFMGVGKYTSKENGKTTKHYQTWCNMFTRCYNPQYFKKTKAYVGCEVCEEWHNFQNFAKWYEDNYYEVDGETMCLDKDILVKGNKVYSPEACVFVPERINTLFVNHTSSKGKHKIGVVKNNTSGLYVARCTTSDGKYYHLGSYLTEDEAFVKYKIAKEKLVKQIATLYKDSIPNKLYMALTKYEV